MESLCLAVADLFCGAGGLSLGFRVTGFELVCAFDSDDAAIETYNANLGDHGLKKDLCQPVALPPVAVVIGGPPCQGFSSAGMRKPGDTRNSLVSHFAQHVVRARPPAFVFENVEGFLTTEDGMHVFELLEPLVSNG